MSTESVAACCTTTLGSGDTQYTYDGDGYLSGISSPDGTISYAYAGGATAPTAITTATTAGGIAGTVTIARNARMQATAIGVAGGPSVEITADADGVVTQVGALEIARSAAGFITATTLGGVSDTYTRNALGEPVTYTARFDGVELFHERYRRDQGGRITGKTVRIVNPDTGGRERYEVAYGYDAGGRLAAVQYNDEPVIEYAYDANNNLIGAPPAPSGSPAPAPTPPPQAALLYLQAAPPAVTPAAHAGTWTDTAARTPAALGLAPEGEVTATSVGAADCDGPGGMPRRVLANVFVSPPLADAYTFTGAEPFALVLGVAQAGAPEPGTAAEESGPAAVASLWVMSAAGGARCVLAADWALHAEPLTSAPRGIEAHVTAGGAGGGCAGITAAPGDRIVLEVGVACAASRAAPLAAAFTRGGGGDPLTAGESPGSGACGLPGTLQLPPGLRLAGTPDAGACAPESTPISLPSRKLLAVQVGAGNQATAAALIEPDGTPRRYAYTYDAHGALDTRTELDEDGAPLPGTTTDYDYDLRGNLRRVALPDGREITYFIDAANRRAGQRVVDAQGSELAVQRLLYLDGLKPLAELDASGAVQTFYVYGDRPNVPEYLIKTTPDPDTGQPTTTHYRLITDTLGSVRLVVDADSGAIVQRIDYDEHGNVLADTDPGCQAFGFAGGMYDGDAGRTRFGVRDFDPAIGRWTARDPIGFSGGDGNLYAYVGNDPANFADPTGFDRVMVEGQLSPGYQRVILDAAGTATGFGAGMETALRYHNKPTASGQVRFGVPNPRSRYGWDRTFHFDAPHGRVGNYHFNAEVGPLSRYNHAPIPQSVYRAGNERVLKAAGRAALVAGIALDTYAIATAPEGQRGQAVCSAAVGWGGAAAGGAAGSYLWPGPGTIVGALIGGLTGSEVAQDVECGR